VSGWCWSNFGAGLQALKPNMTHITSCIELSPSADFVALWLVLTFRKRKSFSSFQRTKLYSYQNLSLRFILEIFLKVCKFQPRHSYKTYFYIKKERVCITKTIRKRIVSSSSIKYLEHFVFTFISHA